MTLGFLLMSGGHSSRMGTPKALLDIGGETLLSRIARAGAAFPERILSVNDPSIPTPEGFARVEDVYTDCGPMGGLRCARRRPVRFAALQRRSRRLPRRADGGRP